MLVIALHETGPQELSAVAPRAGKTPPGHYMLFLLNRDGVPSKATFVRLGPQGPYGAGSRSPATRAPSAAR